jgi:hypothetical protein
MSEPILLVVRRGALRRFATLQRRTSEMQVQVIWDRRSKNRRVADTHTASERRTADRRQRDSYTWSTADFLVAVPGKRSSKSR